MNKFSHTEFRKNIILETAKAVSTLTFHSSLLPNLVNKNGIKSVFLNL